MRLTGSPAPLARLFVLFPIMSVPVAIGTLGFHLIEGASVFDSFYMALITLTTIGYGEFIALSPAGRKFNTLLILAGFAVTFVAVGIMVDCLVELRVVDRIQQGALRRMLRKLKGHYIICGLGRVGLGVLRQLRLEDAKVVVIDMSSGTEKGSSERIDVPVLAEDATQPKSLEQAGIHRAKGLVAALSSDAENVYVTLSARVLNPNVRIVARASSEDAKNRLLQAGADDVVMPYAFTGRRLAQALLWAHHTDFLEVHGTAPQASQRLEMGECQIRSGSELVGRTLADARLSERFNLVVVAFSASGKRMLFNPPPSVCLSEGDVLVVVGPRASIDRLDSPTVSQ